MGFFSPTMPMRPRIERARRRISLLAEPLESRRLLSVAAAPIQAAIAPVNPAPAAVGPIAPAPSAASSAATGGLAANASPSPSPSFSLLLEISPIIVGGGSIAPQGFVETILIVEGPTAGGFSTAAPTPNAGGNAASGLGLTGASTSTSTNPGGSSSFSEITPLTATVLAGPGGNRAAIVVVVVPQTLPINLGSSTIPVTTQAILAVANLEEQPLPPPILGQGFESGQTQGSDLKPETGLIAPPIAVPIEPQLPAFDYIERAAPEPMIPSAPTPAVEPPAAPAPVQGVNIIEALPIEPTAQSDRDATPDFPAFPPRMETQTEPETPTWSMAAVVGTAAVASGGYHLVLGGSNRFNQRWLPHRGSPRKDRGRKPAPV